MKAFGLFDKQNSGFIGFQNLKAVASELGEKLTDEEILDMLMTATRDKTYCKSTTNVFAFTFSVVDDDDESRDLDMRKMIRALQHNVSIDTLEPRVRKENFVKVMKKTAEFGQQPIRFKIVRKTDPNFQSIVGKYPTVIT